MKAQGTTVLLVEQHVEPALGIADRASTRARHQASAKGLLAGNEIKERYCLA
jgi:branched-chain amino acid transport system ATP-binding protein